MKSSEFWLVELGVRMGPLALGTELRRLQDLLRENRVSTPLSLDRSNQMQLPEFGVQLTFSKESPQELIRIDVTDERLRFGSLSVIGKRVHEIVGIFKVSRKETLWCDLADITTKSTSDPEQEASSMSRELLARGTIWIPSLGLGLKLCDGLVQTVHLCDPTLAPRSGTGTWSKEQQRLSEVREIPPASLPPIKHRSQNAKWYTLIHLAMVVSFSYLAWWAIDIQIRWNSATEVAAEVVALDPPPPNPLPNQITVRYSDADGKEYSQTLGHLQFMTTPKMGEQVNVRFLPTLPDKALGPVASRDEGFNRAFPYGIGIMAVYFTLLLLVSVRPKGR